MATTDSSVAQGMTLADFQKFLPLNGFHIFEREPEPDRSGRIILIRKSADDQRKDVSYARVVKVGKPGRLPKSKSGALEPVSLKVGDRVLLTRYAGYDVEVAETSKRYVVAAEQDVHLVVPEADAA